METHPNAHHVCSGNKQADQSQEDARRWCKNKTEFHQLTNHILDKECLLITSYVQLEDGSLKDKESAIERERQMSIPNQSRIKEDASSWMQQPDTLKLNSRRSSLQRRQFKQSRITKRNAATMEQSFKSVTLMMDRHSPHSHSGIIQMRTDRRLDSQELEVITKMAEQNEEQGQSWEVPERCHCTQPCIGRMWLTQRCGR